MNKVSFIFGILSLLFLSSCIEKPFYHPDQVLYQTPNKYSLQYEDVTFKSEDGTKLNGWFVPSIKKAKGTVIHFHGNAQNMSAHFSYVVWLPKNDFNVFVFDYRGYGKSEGSVSRQGIHEDSLAALKYIRNRKDIDTDKIIIFGQSLGGTNAITALALSKDQGFKGIITDSAFASYQTVAKDAVKGTVYAPLSSAFVRETYSPNKVIDQISPTPILIIHGTADSIVEYKHAKMLFDKAKDPKQLWTIKNGRHTQALSLYGKQVIPRLYKQMVKWVESPSPSSTEKNQKNP